MTNFFRQPTGPGPFCGVCGHIVPLHYPDCPVLTQEPQSGFAGTPPEGQPWAGTPSQNPFLWQGQRQPESLEPMVREIARMAATLERIAARWEEAQKTQNK
jgi:hypothetical protein